MLIAYYKLSGPYQGQIVGSGMSTNQGLSRDSSLSLMNYRIPFCCIQSFMEGRNETVVDSILSSVHSDDHTGAYFLYTKTISHGYMNEHRTSVGGAAGLV